MAAPQAKTTKDLNGNWVMNKGLSDSPDPILRAQGIGYLTRKGVNLATIHLKIKQYEHVHTSSTTGIVTCIESTQTASGLKSTKEIRYLDNEFRDHYDWLFGTVKAQARWVALEDIEDAVLKEGWLVEGEGNGLVLCHAVSQENGWTASQIWGFQVVGGERRYCMRVAVASKGDQKAYARFVYDYQLE
ncbi:hypothetical protein FOXG_11946 [Fusarium oxysporum f. sp. lycopersici 4287]|uniref:LCCL domain-containing protein n=3 Tax=Fusarium oxysporum TaxID=5507 RepID=A0A0J9WRD1_FUSO4|nr:hypothetical protein FOXG_11946 [Fusarium oxysporum f. sp. lycopersici 4287]EXK25523.1 hypothetical protein FOMG_17824 [Fusarium oxysporum f. sp. melonis 26406]KAJ9414056.1 hypothetical protein QL093DRAFT_2088972 [Fusarium oxysporum]KNB12322.1 hypothetical protein FOXG_11946 [Fusarium oxysporum f. sp. lycopersici 4287]